MLIPENAVGFFMDEVPADFALAYTAVRRLHQVPPHLPGEQSACGRHQGRMNPGRALPDPTPQLPREGGRGVSPAGAPAAPRCRSWRQQDRKDPLEGAAAVGSGRRGLTLAGRPAGLPGSRRRPGSEGLVGGRPGPPEVRAVLRGRAEHLPPPPLACGCPSVLGGGLSVVRAVWPGVRPCARARCRPPLVGALPAPLPPRPCLRRAQGWHCGRGRRAVTPALHTLKPGRASGGGVNGPAVSQEHAGLVAGAPGSRSAVRGRVQASVKGRFLCFSREFACWKPRAWEGVSGTRATAVAPEGPRKTSRHHPDGGGELNTGTSRRDPGWLLGVTDSPIPG
nr:collagen alpha-1(III) chain-like [Neomonachus schauinslandi]